MAVPSQAYPPWLSPSPVVVTNPAGGLATGTTIVYIAPTYYGPSIPLGSLYSYGGSTYPPSIQLPGSPKTTVATPTTTIATPPTITTAAPTSSVSISNSPTTTPATPSSSLTASLISPTITSVSVSSTLTSTSSSSSLTTSLISTSSSTSTSLSSLTTSLIPTSSSTFTSSFSGSSTSAAPTSTITPAQVSRLTKGQLVGVVVASILGLIFLFVLALFLYLFCKGRRNRQPFNTLETVDDDYFVVPPGGHTPGEGSPRHSGEEEDPFLQRRSAGTPRTAAAAAAAMTQVPPGMIARTHTASRVPPPTNGSNSSASTVSHASGFGVLLDRPSSGYLPGVTEESHQEGGTILSPAQMQRLEQETVLPDDQEQYDDGYTGAYAYSPEPLLPPPRLVDPATLSSPGMAHPFRNNNPYFPKDPSVGGEDSTTARRVKVEDISSRSPPQLPDAFAGPSHKGSTGILGALGLRGLANLGSRSWFKNLDSPGSSVVPPNFESEPLSEKDLESGRAILGLQADSFGNKIRGGVGVGPDGSRPKSSISARSGASGTTLYHDAQSSLPSTPLLASLPPAVTTAEQPVTMSERSWFTSPLAGPPAYEDDLLDLTSPSPAHSPGSTNHNVLPGSDILDMPAPSAFNHFSSISSLRETATGSSIGIKSLPFPPGLETVRPVGWAETVTAVASSPSGSSAIMSGIEHHSALSLDPLEEGPPDAELGWRSMASLVNSSSRRTFGQFVQQPDFTSEQGSLHSMRSHLNPSTRSTGSAPASRRDGSSSYGSTSSRPSRHSMALSIAHSLARTGSISSDSRKRLGHGQISPALSAFGPQLRASSGGSGQPQEPPSSGPVISSPPSVHMSPDKSTVRSMGSGSATLMDSSFGTLRGTSRATSPNPSDASFTFSSPWAGGLDNDWTPAA